MIGEGRGGVSDPRAVHAVPGWYPDPVGTLRWWDGQAWGPAAGELPPGGPFAPQPNKTLAVLSHLGPILGGFVLPLVIYLAADRNDHYVRHHASEGLNFQLSFLIVWLIGFVAIFVGFSGLAATSGSGDGSGAAFGIGFVLLFFGMFGLMAASWVFAIIGAIQASKGNWWRYPVCIRFVKGAAPKGTPPLVNF